MTFLNGEEAVLARKQYASEPHPEPTYPYHEALEAWWEVNRHRLRKDVWPDTVARYERLMLKLRQVPESPCPR